jgi:hypothetical protein
MLLKLFLKLLLVFLCSVSSGYTGDGYLVHRDQFFLNDGSIEKKGFYTSLQSLNDSKTKTIRDYKEKYKDETGNILLSSLYLFYDEEYKEFEKKEISKVFLSGWLPPTNVKDLQDSMQKEAFCLGSSYEKYPYFSNASKILSIKRKPGHNSLSQSIKESGDFHPNTKPLVRERDDITYENTFVYKLIEDFSVRGIEFESVGGATYQHQNHAHTEQAFFSYIEHSLTAEDTFNKADIPKAILVNMVSYLPTCSGGFCLTAIKNLLSSEQFKYKFLKKVIPNVYQKNERNWSELIKTININLLYTSSDLPLSDELDFIRQNGMLFKSYN